MSSAVDIFLRLIGDSRSAVSALDDTTTAAKRTDQAVEKIGQTSQRTGQSLAATASQVATQFTAAYGIVSEVAQRVADMVDSVTGTTKGDVAAADKAVLSAGSTAELLSAFSTDQNKHAGIGANLSRIWRGATTRGAWGGISTSWRALQDELHGTVDMTAFDNLYAADPARARALAAAAPQWAGRLAQLEGSGAAGFKQQIAAQYGTQPQTVVNVHSATAHLNDGESLRAIIQRAERNNGRSTTFTRP
jgi:hypothetical protein